MRSRDRDSEYREKIAGIIERMDTDVKERLHGLTDAYQTQMLDVMDRALKASAPVKEARGPGMAEMVGSSEIQEQIASEKQLMEKVLEIEMRHADEKLASDLRYLQDLYRRYRFVMRDYMG